MLGISTLKDVVKFWLKLYCGGSCGKIHLYFLPIPQSLLKRPFFSPQGLLKIWNWTRSHDILFNLFVLNKTLEYLTECNVKYDFNMPY